MCLASLTPQFRGLLIPAFRKERMNPYCQIPVAAPGRLFFGARPRRPQDVSYFDSVLCLLEPEEIQELELQWLQAWHLPIPDRGLPSQLGPSFQRALELLNAGGSLLVHCRAGIGRSALVTACLVAVVEPQRTAEEIWTTLCLARGLEVPDTEEQRQWLQHFRRSRRAPKFLDEALLLLE